MKPYSSLFVDRIRELRKKGTSLGKLGKQFNIPSSTISRWVRDIDSQQKIYINARAQETLLKNQFISTVETFKITKESAQMLASFLYWCEGSKYPSSNCVAFSNSDPAMIKTFIELLNTGFSMDQNKIKVLLQVHSTHNYQEVLAFWSNLLNIPSGQFYKPTITHPTKNMKRRNYQGTCMIKYYDVKLLISLMGIYENFVKIYIPKGGVAEWPKA